MIISTQTCLIVQEKGPNGKPLSLFLNGRGERI